MDKINNIKQLIQAPAELFVLWKDPNTQKVSSNQVVCLAWCTTANKLQGVFPCFVLNRNLHLVGPDEQEFRGYQFRHSEEV